MPCSSSFRDSVHQIARDHNSNVADIARSVLLVLPEQIIHTFSDPGEPDLNDREETWVKTGTSKGKRWRRKPRLQLRLKKGYEISLVRRALNLALALNNRAVAVSVSDPVLKQRSAQSPDVPGAELARLRAIVATLVFQPLPAGVKTREDALYVLGLPPTACPDEFSLRSRFRKLAPIHHPDSIFGSHQRMSQLNMAMELLKTHP